MSYLSLDLAIWKVIFCLVVSAVTIFFSWQNWRRAKSGSKAVYVLEILRILTLVLLVMTFLEPEWVKIHDKNEKPLLLIGVDSSSSMNTEDAVSDGKVMSRKFFAEKLLQRPEIKNLEQNFKVKVVKFAGEKGNLQATNMNLFMQDVLSGNDLPRAVVLMGDGDWNEGGDPLETALLLRGKVPFLTVGIGSEKYLPDLALENVLPPAYGLVKEKVNIPFQVSNHFDKEIKALVTLSEENGEKLNKEMTIPAGQFSNGNFVWNPTKSGIYKFTMSVPVVEGEYVVANNKSSFVIEVKEEKLKVLLIESWPRWEYRFLRNALMRDPGVEVYTVLYQMAGMKQGAGLNYLPEFPRTKEELAKFDVVFLGDVQVGEGQLKKDQASMINGLVKSQGSGLVFMPGHLGNQLKFAEIEELDELLPVVYDLSGKDYALQEESHLLLTFDGRDHHLTMLADKVEYNRDLWRSLPGFFWSAPVKKAKDGTRVLAVHSNLSNEWGRLPLLVTKPVGNGQVLFMGTDAAYRWRHGIEDKYHYRFWGQVVRWMANKRHLSADENIRLFYYPVKPAQGDLVNLQVTVHNTLGQPYNNGDVEAEIISPANNNVKIKFKNTDAEWGLYEGEFKAVEAGKYRLKVIAKNLGKEHEVEIEVKPNGLEVTGKPASLNVMKEIANLTKGEFIEAENFGLIEQKIQQLPEPKIEEKRYRLWNQPWWLGLIIGLLSLHWIVSKKMGLI